MAARRSSPKTPPRSPLEEAADPNALPERLAALTTHRDKAVRVAALANPQTPLAAIVDGMKVEVDRQGVLQADDEVWAAALGNPAWQLAVLEQSELSRLYAAGSLTFEVIRYFMVWFYRNGQRTVRANRGIPPRFSRILAERMKAQTLSLHAQEKVFRFEANQDVRSDRQATFLAAFAHSLETMLYDLPEAQKLPAVLETYFALAYDLEANGTRMGVEPSATFEKLGDWFGVSHPRQRAYHLLRVLTTGVGNTSEERRELQAQAHLDLGAYLAQLREGVERGDERSKREAEGMLNEARLILRQATVADLLVIAESLVPVANHLDTFTVRGFTDRMVAHVRRDGDAADEARLVALDL